MVALTLSSGARCCRASKSQVAESLSRRKHERAERLTFLGAPHYFSALSPLISQRSSRLYHIIVSAVPMLLMYHHE